MISSSPDSVHFFVKFYRKSQSDRPATLPALASKSTFYLGGWVSKIITKSVANGYSFVHVRALECLTISLLFTVSQNLSDKRTVVKCIF